ncbi:MAG TPA: LLM class flavin-dependent oxidoreductase [Acidimicrobiales bacterium]|nr:LLM class flavin-dependent oxidoreductase [Acidimicrobiales bacterium]
MRLAVNLGGRDWAETLTYVREAERLGVAAAWSAEAWGTDAVTPLAWLAGQTERILLGSGIMQISSRTPAMTAQTAMTMAQLSGGRFLMGLGASGPQVVEGLHGQPFAHPLGRMRETIDIVRLAMSGARVEYHGRHFELPRPRGEGKALRLQIRAVDPVPIYIASLSPKMLELTGEVADGWLGTSFVPEGAAEFLRHIETGAKRAGRSLAAIDLSQGGDVAFGDDVEAMVARRKPGLAFSLGGMGSATTNFYNDAYSRQGFAEVADAVRRLWVSGQRDRAAEAVPDEMVLATTMIGTEQMVADRMRAWRDAGITTLRVYPAGDNLEARLDTLGRAVDIARSL